MITLEQNNDRQIKRLAAQRRLYSTSKRIFGWQLFLSGLLAVIFSFLVVFDPSLKTYAVSWGILITLMDIFWFTPWQGRLKDSAAKIQEMFDCDVLELPWNDLKAGKRPDPELIKEQAKKYAKKPLKNAPLEDWYDHPDLDSLPIHVGRIACQRTNIWWDAKQRRNYANSIILIVTLIFIVVFGLSLNGGFNMEDFILKVLAPLSPLFLLGIRQYREQIDSANRLDKLNDYIKSLWRDALLKKSKSELTTKSRNLQDELFEHRRKTPPIFDFIFEKLRNSYNDNMNFGLDELIKEAKKVYQLQ
ncbi:hypothetical protein CWO84_15020 [Methylomonas sp. Kb3]|uniref:S-4TM family putative pore-forming effector n=1 Tax=Methylomonas sp. Kb3 TaxID=1611544 RepID=UPI000C33E63C|nr:S-4TM family putative pore-forming effector [Methylomonas sp. Kb3]PKD39514.1 hypothetical protein CWO84_15020 [Methylomonas sp. Kb3]